MLRVGFVGWRGMVGSVLLERMRAESDFQGIEPVFFSTSNAGGRAPAEAGAGAILGDAHDCQALAACDVIVSCQGGGFTTSLRAFARRGLERLLDRRRIHAAHGR
ncbi:MAG: hypothetical protein R2762_12570 [Bryobacteraceae bacterium]